MHGRPPGPEVHHELHDAERRLPYLHPESLDYRHLTAHHSWLRSCAGADALDYGGGAGHSADIAKLPNVAPLPFVDIERRELLRACEVLFLRQCW